MSTVQNLIAQLQQGSIGQWYVTKSPTDRLIINLIALIAAIIYTVAETISQDHKLMPRY